MGRGRGRARGGVALLVSLHLSAAVGCEERGPCAGATDVIAGAVLVTTQEELDALSNTRSIGGLLLVTDDAIDLTPLQCLEEVGELEVRRAASVQEIPDLPHLRTASSVVLSDLPGLTRVGELGEGSVTIVESLRLKDLPALLEFPPLSRVESLAGVSIDNTGLQRLDFLSSLRAVDWLVVANNPQLESLAGMASLMHVRDSLLVSGNDALAPCDDWELVRQLETVPEPEFSVQAPEADCPP